MNQFLIPYFPDSNYLQNKAWHRLAKVIAYAVEIWVAKVVFLDTDWEIFFHYDTTSYQAWALAADIGVISFGLFSVNLVYRLILYVVLGNKWKNENNKKI